MKKMLYFIFAFLIGIIPAFFIVFNAVFSDSNGSIFERLITFLLVIVVYGALGFGFGYFSPIIAWKWGLSVSLPAAILLMLYSFKEVNLIPLPALYLLLTLLSSCFGGYLGGILGVKRKYKY